MAREVSGTRLRALLVLLALRAGQVVPAGLLIDELWGERLPADAPNALQALVSRLRRAVGEPAAVASSSAGYQLRADRDEDDLPAARSNCDRALAAALPTRASATIADALIGLAAVTLWSGDAPRAVTVLGMAEGVRGTTNRSDDDEQRVTAAARALLSHGDYSAAFQRGQEVTLATLEATLAEVLNPGA